MIKTIKQTERAKKVLKKSVAKGIGHAIGDEDIIDATIGRADGKMLWKTAKMACMVVLTPTRVIVSTNGGFRSKDVFLNKISSIDAKTGIFGGKVTFHASGNDLTVDQMVDSADFIKNVKSQLGAKVEHQPASQPVDVADQIKKLAELKDQGVLTEEEFASQKQKLLGM